ncbi:MAG: hypothetical protein ACKV19_15870 [Verrucomicrobiales bacterium]
MSDTDGAGGGIMLDGIQVIEGMLTIDSISRVENGLVVLRARGFPNVVHRIQASGDLSPGSFVDLGAVAADAKGRLEFRDTRTGLSITYYRVAYP